MLFFQDEIAWIFNLRGKGSSNNEGLMHSPLFDSFALISMDDIFLWIHTDMADSEVLVHLTPEDCQTNKYYHFHGNIIIIFWVSNYFSLM